MAVAMALASQITAVAAEMAVPPLLGYWVDRWLGTGFVFVALGAILGLVVGMATLLRMGAADRRRDAPSKPPPENDKTRR
jgi:F0F1-type ATP synthase assembly protein I